jgi:hypothetical protein
MNRCPASDKLSVIGLEAQIKLVEINGGFRDLAVRELRGPA